ncbi:MAG: hypothetical protein HC808_11410, partial [Candidatus Competibacteraceae bacterium]|nr:hypothetical protein [Candidatus Competibacteraceae bacterium]
MGFDVNQEEREQLVCIAEAGGGRYFSADSTAQLQNALTQVKQEVVQVAVTPPPAPPAQPPAPTGATGIQLQTVLATNGEVIKDQLGYEVLSAQQDLQGKREQIAVSYDAQPLFKLEPGQYHLRVKYGSNESNAVSKVDIEVKAGELTPQVISLEAGYVRLITVPAEGAEPLAEAMNYEMFSAAKDLEGNRKQVAFSYDAQPVFKLKAGKYHLRIAHGSNESNVVTEADVEVKAGELSEQIISLEAGYLRLATLPVEGSEPLAKDLSYDVFGAQQDLQGNRTRVAFSYDARPLFRLKAGAYR